jgi:hypothetical protein
LNGALARITADMATPHRSELDALVDLLLARETVDGCDVYLPVGRRAVPPAVPRH